MSVAGYSPTHAYGGTPQVNKFRVEDLIKQHMMSNPSLKRSADEALDNVAKRVNMGAQDLEQQGRQAIGRVGGQAVDRFNRYSDEAINKIGFLDDEGKQLLQQGRDYLRDQAIGAATEFGEAALAKGKDYLKEKGTGFLQDLKGGNFKGAFENLGKGFGQDVQKGLGFLKDTGLKIFGSLGSKIGKDAQGFAQSSGAKNFLSKGLGKLSKGFGGKLFKSGVARMI